jgi:SAM-dependent methyltransferase
MTDDEEFWNGRYAEHHRLWSGNPNELLVREIASLEPGRALDLGCGEGADAIWLARNGWRVTATDISSVALERAAKHAVDAGVSVDWQHRDLTTSFPEGEFDLVSVQFLHSPTEFFPRERILRAAAAAVAPGGRLLIVGHAGPPPWEPEADHSLPTPDEVHASLKLSDDEWKVLLSGEHDRTQRDPHGELVTRRDNALLVQRKAG